MSTPNSGFVAESFTVDAVGGTYCDGGGFRCHHELTPQPNGRVVSAPGEFTAHYADTLGADGSAALHAPGCARDGGASIGVVDNASVPDLATRRAYQISAAGIDGLVYVCLPLFEVQEGFRVDLCRSTQSGYSYAAFHSARWAPL